MLTLLDALADTSRRDILGELMHGQKKVGELVLATGLKQPNVSNHLAKMRTAGILRCTKVGREVFYAINNPDLVHATRSIVFDQGEKQYLTLDPTAAVDFARWAASGETNKCEETVAHLLRQSEPLSTIYTKLFIPALKCIGDWWQVNAIDVAQEHLASSIIEQSMSRVSHFYDRTHRNGMKAVLGCSEGNLHSIGLKMIYDLLRSRGWESLYLGADLPNEPFLKAVERHKPHVVLVSCCSDTTIDRCQELLASLNNLRATGLDFKICIGGTAVRKHDNLRGMGVYSTAKNLTEFTDVTLPYIEKSLIKIG